MCKFASNFNILIFLTLKKIIMKKRIFFFYAKNKVFLSGMPRSLRLTVLFCLLSLLTVTNVFAQSNTLSGVVLDEATNDPLIGVSIAVKGAPIGAVSDVNGEFSLNVSSDATLVVSYIGYLTKEVPVNGQSKLTIVLSEDTKALDEVIVVGFGTQKKINLTGAVGIINAKDLADRPVQSAAQALQGLSTGLNITQTNGSLEDKASINIRGVGTIGEGSKSDPLVLIDGMEGDINTINPQDIESISVLKDASTASIYGSRAPFGVILVTTKKGQQGKAKFNYNNNFRWTSPVLLPQMLDSYSFAQYYRDAMLNGHETIPATGRFSDEHLQRILDFQNGTLKESVPAGNNGQWLDGYDNGNANTDWYKEIYKSQSLSQEHNVSLTGGTETINYYVSGNFLGQDGLMKLNQDIYNRYTATGKVSAKFVDWATLNYSTRFIRTEYERPSALTNGLYHDLARQGWPTLPLYDPNGYLYSSPSPALGLRDGGQDMYQKDQLYQQVQLVLEPIKNWKTFAEFNYRTEDNFRNYYTLVTYNHDIEGNPIAYGKSSGVYEFASRANYANINVYSEYFKSFNDTHNFKIMAGFQNEEQKFRQFDARKDGVLVTDLLSLNTTSGLDYNGNVITPAVNGLYYDWSTAGFFGRLNYDYLGKYLAEVNIRYDASSRFRSEKRWNIFPSFSLGWNIARESFWEDHQNELSTFKFRASYGELGNQNTGYLDGQSTKAYYPTYLIMTMNEGNGRNWLINGIKPNTTWAPTPVSAALTWESVNTFDVGLDIAALNNRLTLTADYYLRRTLNMVGPAPTLPAIYGYDVPSANNTDLETRGWEIDLGWKDRLNFGLGYSVHLLISDYRSKVTKYFNPTGDIGKYYTGKYLGDIWGFETIGIAKTQEEMDAHIASLPQGGQDAIGSEWKAGDIMYRDLDGNGKISSGAGTLDDPGDKRIIGNNSPRFPFAVDISLDYKGFDIRAFFQGIGKRDYWQPDYYFWGVNGGAESHHDGTGLWHSSGFVQHLDYFRPADTESYFGPNVDAYYPNPYFNTGKNMRTQTRYLLDASYIRLKNIQLGYTLPTTLTHKFGCSKLRIFASGENLWTLTNLTEIFDPETIGGGWESAGNVYPLSKVISVGLSINF
jgi:TonB-linked SusC/RagA family outer membrane protein